MQNQANEDVLHLDSNWNSFGAFISESQMPQVKFVVNADSLEETINDAIANTPSLNKSKISDGFHTFQELYDIRKAYNVALFNAWAKHQLYDVHKSIRHNDGELCFGGGWFIVVAVLPGGQISNHYEMEDWDLFDIPETEKAKFEFDGHTTQDVIDRLLKL